MLAIVINIAVYVISSMPTRAASGKSSRCCHARGTGGAGLRPPPIVGAWRAPVAIAAVAVVALVPLAAAATRSPATPAAAGLSTWLEAHRLTTATGGAGMPRGAVQSGIA